MFHTKSSLSSLILAGLVACAAFPLPAFAEAADVAAVPVKTPPPSYPTKMKHDGVTGIVALKVEVDESGTVANCVVSKSSNPEFNDSAVSAVMNWKFKPAQKNGAPVKTTILIPIKFTLDD